MTFTQYLRHLIAMGLAPSFRLLLDHRDWPDGSTRLEDYEYLIWRHLGGPRASALLELQMLWSRWADGPATTADLDADHALLAWREYTVHLRDCPVRAESPCPRAEQLLIRAIGESHFHDLESIPADPVPCEDPDDAEARRQRELAADQIVGLIDVEALLHQRHRQPRIVTVPRPTKQ